MPQSGKEGWSAARRVRFLINPKSGYHMLAKTVDSLEAGFSGPEWRLDIRCLQNPFQARDLAADAVARGYWAVVVVGGDGTIHEAVQALAGSNVLLGVIPKGAGNGLARGLKIPLNMNRAIEVVRDGQSKSVDLGLINGERYFINICGAGFDALIARTANDYRALGRINALARYLAAGLACLFHYRPGQLKIHNGETIYEGPVQAVVVCNTPQYGFDMKICPEADPCDGNLNLVVIPPMRPLLFLKNVVRLMLSRPLNGAVYVNDLQEVTIEKDPLNILYYHADGEPIGQLPLHILFSQAKIRVLVP